MMMTTLKPFESILSQLSRENKNIILTADFNINLLNCESHPESNDFSLMLNSYFLLPYILQPTRITERSATLIDNIFSNTYAVNTTSGNLVLRIQDHLPQLSIVDNVKVNHKTLHYYKNDYSKFDEEKWINDFALLDWANIFNNKDFRYMKIHIFALRWKDEIRRPSQLRTLLKRVVVNKAWKKFQARTGFEPMTSAIPVNNNLHANTKFDVFFMINDDYIERRHAERVLEEELNTRGKPVWYLAHYPEKHP